MPDDQELLALVKKAHDLLGFNQSNEFLTNLQRNQTFERGNQVKAALILRELIAQATGKSYLSTSIDGSRAHYSQEGAGPEGGLPLLKKFGYQPGPAVEAMKADIFKVKDFEWSEMHMESIKSILEDSNLTHTLCVGSENSAMGYQVLRTALVQITNEVAAWHSGYDQTVKSTEPPVAVKSKAKKS